MDNFIKNTLVSFFILLYSFNAFSAQKVMYVNGIQNKKSDARKTARKLNSLLKKSENHIERNTFEVFYTWNPIGWDGDTQGPDLREDLSELYVSKYYEEYYGGKLGDIYAPHNQTTPGLNKEFATDIIAYKNKETPSIQLPIKVGLNFMNSINSPTVVVAHSQGNLIANYWWADYVSKHGDDAFKKIRIVNVANTAVYSPNQLNFTHAGDAALFEEADSFSCPEQSLETLAIRKKWLRLTSVCSHLTANAGSVGLAAYCKFNLAKPTFDAADGEGLGVDACLDHSITSTYMSDNEVILKTNQGVNHGVGIRFKDRLEDLIYTASESLNKANETSPKISNVDKSIDTGIVSESTTFYIIGTDFPETLAMKLGDVGCNQDAHTSVLVTFSCTPTVAGDISYTIYDKEGGSAVEGGTGTYTVVKDTGGGTECTPLDTTQDTCGIANGSGEQSKVCNSSRSWENVGSCIATSCNDGYTLNLSDNSCDEDGTTPACTKLDVFTGKKITEYLERGFKDGTDGVSQVAQLQNFLTQEGHDAGTADGIFGGGTESAVKSYQSANGLDADGKVGTNTQAKINASCGS